MQWPHLFIRYFNNLTMNKIKSNPYKTILTISFGFFVVFMVWKTNWALLTALIISFLGLISLRLAKLIEKIWFKIAEFLGFFIPNIVLTVVFYLFLFPLSILFKFSKTRENAFKEGKSRKSNYFISNKKFTDADFLNPW